MKSRGNAKVKGVLRVCTVHCTCTVLLHSDYFWSCVLFFSLEIIKDENY